MKAYQGGHEFGSPKLQDCEQAYNAMTRPPINRCVACKRIPDCACAVTLDCNLERDRLLTAPKLSLAACRDGCVVRQDPCVQCTIFDPLKREDHEDHLSNTILVRL